MHLIGLFFDIPTGALLMLDEARQRFVPVAEHPAASAPVITTAGT